MAALFRKLRLFSTVVRTNKTMRGVFFAVAKDWEIIQQCGGGKKKKQDHDFFGRQSFVSF